MRRYFPDIDTFKASAQGADVVPVYRQLLADHLTPVTAFEVLGRDAHAFLLESVVGGEQVARHSFIATSPALVYQAYNGRASISRGGYGYTASTTRSPASSAFGMIRSRSRLSWMTSA